MAVVAIISSLPRSKPSHRVSCFSATPNPKLKQVKLNSLPEYPNYQPGMLDNLLLSFFRGKMVQEVGWDSEKEGYNGLIEVANRLMVAKTNSQTRDASVRVIRSLFPAWLIRFFKLIFAPLRDGEVAGVMVAWATASSCQWLMGPCKVNSVTLPNGSSWKSGVFVERCKYLEESKCLGICLNTCKLPTETFFKDYMGVPLTMEPNVSDYSCQFNFGVIPPPVEDDSIFKEPCLEICPNARRRKTNLICPNS